MKLNNKQEELLDKFIELGLIASEVVSKEVLFMESSIVPFYKLELRVLTQYKGKPINNDLMIVVDHVLPDECHSVGAEYLVEDRLEKLIDRFTVKPTECPISRDNYRGLFCDSYLLGKDPSTESGTELISILKFLENETKQ